MNVYLFAFTAAGLWKTFQHISGLEDTANLTSRSDDFTATPSQVLSPKTHVHVFSCSHMHLCRFPCAHKHRHPCCAHKISTAFRNSTNTSYPMWMHIYTHSAVNAQQLMWNHIHLLPVAPPMLSFTNSWGLHSTPLALPDVVFTCLVVVCNSLHYVRPNYPTWVLVSAGVIALEHSKLNERRRDMVGEASWR